MAKSIWRATSIDSGAVYRTRGRYATGTAARGQLGENPGDGRELKFLGVIAGRNPPLAVTSPFLNSSEERPPGARLLKTLASQLGPAGGTASMRGPPAKLPMAGQANDLISTDRGQSKQCAQEHRSENRSWQTAVATKGSSARD